MRLLKIITIAFLSVSLLLWGLARLIFTDGEQKRDGYEQLMAFTLSYNVPSGTMGQSVLDGSSWYVTLYHLKPNGEQRKCDKQQVSFEHYKMLETLVNENPNKMLVIPAWLYESFPSGTTCEIYIQDWQHYLQMRQPPMHDVMSYNLRRYKEANNGSVNARLQGDSAHLG